MNGGSRPCRRFAVKFRPERPPAGRRVRARPASSGEIQQRSLGGKFGTICRNNPIRGGFDARSVEDSPSPEQGPAKPGSTCSDVQIPPRRHSERGGEVQNLPLISAWRAVSANLPTKLLTPGARSAKTRRLSQIFRRRQSIPRPVSVGRSGNGTVRMRSRSSRLPCARRLGADRVPSRLSPHDNLFPPIFRATGGRSARRPFSDTGRLACRCCGGERSFCPSPSL